MALLCAMVSNTVGVFDDQNVILLFAEFWIPVAYWQGQQQVLYLGGPKSRVTKLSLGKSPSRDVGVEVTKDEIEIASTSFNALSNRILYGLSLRDSPLSSLPCGSSKHHGGKSYQICTNLNLRRLEVRNPVPQARSAPPLDIKTLNKMKKVVNWWEHLGRRNSIVGSRCQCHEPQCSYRTTGNMDTWHPGRGLTIVTVTWPMTHLPT